MLSAYKLFTNFDLYADSLSMQKSLNTARSEEPQVSGKSNELALMRTAFGEHAIVAFTDSRGTITYVNNKFCKISGYSQSELVGKNHRIINSGHHPKQFFIEMWRTISAGETWRGEICNQAKNGNLYWVDTTIVPFKNQHGEIFQYVSIRADITDRKGAEHELKLQKYAIDEHAIVAITDSRGIITYVNKKFCIISGYSHAELIGKTHRIINSGHHPKQFFIDMWKTITSGETWRGEVCNRDKSSRLYWVDTTIVPVKMQGSERTQYISIRADITGRKSAEQELVRVNGELKEFVQAASHDLKSPLVTMMGFIEILEDCISTDMDSDTVADCLKRIKTAAERMKCNINDLLDLSQIGHLPVNLEEVDLHTILEELQEELASLIQSACAEVRVELSGASLWGDVVRVRQLLLNLLTNSLKYGRPDSGQCIITISGGEDGGKSWLAISDNGPGINPQFHDKVFDLFQRLDNSCEGTGIGLSIVRRIVELHAGQIQISETDGGGATFRIEFPRQSVLADVQYTDRQTRTSSLD